MIYLFMSGPFLLAAAVVFGIGAARASRSGDAPGFWRDAATTGLVLIVLTIVFDNIMIAAGFFDYGAQQISGARIGLVPVEDLLYPVAGTLLIAGLTQIVGTRPERMPHGDDA